MHNNLSINAAVLLGLIREDRLSRESINQRSNQAANGNSGGAAEMLLRWISLSGNSCSPFRRTTVSRSLHKCDIYPNCEMTAAASCCGYALQEQGWEFGQS
ncbi:hypothetical protein ILYODFUR_037628 [Ilyodon furcidens]|uniref:Uncharacterized protein n=1 Tax=Ilyodon furcidens TaxID=33524 RepID=A0ABV0UYG5_9TELE